jgi:DNA gyrase inhibitor GyrI
MDFMVGLSRIDQNKKGDNAFIYQAGITLKSKPKKIPKGLKTRKLDSRTYARFLLTGPYSQLAQAYPQAIDIIIKMRIKIRDDFFIERYLNNPSNTIEEKLKTEILIPIF